MGFSALAAASRTAAATSSSSVTSGGMKQVSTESTSGSAKAVVQRLRGTRRPSPRCGSDTGPWVTVSPQLVQASAVSVPSAVELPTTATRSPAGSGWWATSWATSKSWWTFSTRMTPACLSIA